MQRDLPSYLCDVEEACKRIQEYTNALSFEQYVADDRTRLAVERCFEIVGEALSQASRHFSETEKIIPGLRRIVGLRNVWVHQYADVNDGKIWDVVQHDIGPMIAIIQGWQQRIENETT